VIDPKAVAALVGDPEIKPYSPQEMEDLAANISVMKIDDRMLRDQPGYVALLTACKRLIATEKETEAVLRRFTDFVSNNDPAIVDAFVFVETNG
jgi:hypothetical protein